MVASTADNHLVAGVSGKALQDIKNIPAGEGILRSGAKRRKRTIVVEDEQATLRSNVGLSDALHHVSGQLFTAITLVKLTDGLQFTQEAFGPAFDRIPGNKSLHTLQGFTLLVFWHFQGFDQRLIDLLHVVGIDDDGIG